MRRLAVAAAAAAALLVLVAPAAPAAVPQSASSGVYAPMRQRREIAGCLVVDPNNNKKCSECQDGYSISTNGQSCIACNAGTVDHDGDDGTACQSCSTGGYYIPLASSGSCTSASFRCAAGKADTDSSPVTDCADCPTGSESAAGSTSCTTCPAGKTDSDQTPGTPCLQCPAGTYVQAGQALQCSQYACISVFTDHDSDPATPCQACSIGQQVPASRAGACIDCSGGKTDHDNNPETACVTCPAGTYTPSNSVGTCASKNCAAGFVDDDSDPTTVCLSCSTTTGSYIPSGSAGLCSSASFQCATGTTDHDSNAATACQACPAGTIAPRGHSGACLTSCEQAGFEKDGASCTACPAGKIDHDGTPNTACQTCSTAGYFVPEQSTGGCTDVEFKCPAGTVDHDNDPSTSCLACTSTTGSFIPAGSTGICGNSAFKCAAGSTDHDSDPSTACVSCASTTGSFIPVGSAGACASAAFHCEAGTLDTDDDPITACVACPSTAGSYIPPGSNGACSDASFKCLAGTIDDDSDASTPCDSCASVAVGSFVPSGQTGACTNPAFRCAAGTTDHDSNPGSSCQSCSSTAGSFIPVGSSGACALADFKCAAGTTDHDSNPSSACQSCAVSAIGSFIPVGSVGLCTAADFKCAAGSTDHDSNPSTSCVPCTSTTGSFIPIGSAGACSDASFKCAAGSTDADGSATTECLSCGAGFSVPAGSTGACSLFACAAGTVDHDSSPTNACQSCSSTTGSFIPAASSGACGSSSFQCAAGTADLDTDPATQCAACADGTYAAAGSTLCTQCVSGTTDHDSDPATACQNCPAGTFTSAGASGACPQCKTTGATDHDSNPSTACVTCSAGQETPSSGIGSCVNCPAGKADLDLSPVTSCQSCPGGTFAAAQSTTCTVCPAGSVDGDNDPASACEVCTSLTGAYVPPESVGLCSSSAFLCPAGRVDQDQDPATPCTACSLGTYAAAGSTTCTSCLAGTTDHDLNAATPCQNCPAGTFQDVGQTGTCPACAGPTTDHDSNPATACQSCPSGSQVPASRAGPCQICPAGKADLDSSAATSCSDCPAGTYAAAQSTLCTACPAGKSDVDRSAATECATCSAPGTYVPPSTSVACSHTSLLCPAGTLDHDRDPATPCASGCPPGTALNFQGVAASTTGLTLTEACNENRCPIGTVDHDSLVTTACVSCLAGSTYADEVGLTSCKTVSACSEGQYQASPATVSTNRDCQPITSCQTGEIETVAPTATSDRQCTVADNLPLDCRGYPSTTGLVFALDGASGATRQLLCMNGWTTLTRFFQPALTPINPLSASDLLEYSRWIEGRSMFSDPPLRATPTTSSATATVESLDWMDFANTTGHPFKLRLLLRAGGSIQLDADFEFDHPGFASFFAAGPAQTLTLYNGRVRTNTLTTATTASLPPTATFWLPNATHPSAGFHGSVAGLPALAPDYAVLGLTTTAPANPIWGFSPALTSAPAAPYDLRFLIQPTVHTPPVFSQSFFQARIPISTAVGTIALATTATTDAAHRVRYTASPVGLETRVQRGRELFSFDNATGLFTLKAAALEADVATYEWTITAWDDRQVCVTQQSATQGATAESGPCKSTTTAKITIRFEFFTFCPTSVDAFVQNAQSVVVNFDEPVANPAFEITLDATQNSGTVFPVGSTEVTFSGLTSGDVLAACTFNVNVFPGAAVAVPASGLSSVATPQRSHAEYLADATGLFNGARLPPLTLDLTSSTRAVLSLAGIDDSLIRFLHTDNCDPVLRFDLTWCASGSWPSSGTPATTAGSVEVSFRDLVYPPDDTLALASGSVAEVLNDGRCFRIQATTQAITTNLRTSKIFVQINFPSSVPFGSSLQTFFPARDSSVALVYPASGIGCAAIAEIESLVIRDTVPPSFVNCPASFTQDVSSGTSAVVDWTPPVAFDDVEVRSLTSSHQPQTTFSLAQSPITVSYTATDTAGNSRVCSFVVTLDFDPVVGTTALTMNRANFKTLTLGTAAVFEHFDLSELTPTVNLDLAASTAVDIDIQLPAGERFEITVPPGGKVQFELNVVLRLGGVSTLSPSKAGGDEFVTVSFLNAAGFDIVQPWFKPISDPVVSVDGDFIQVVGTGGTDITSSFHFETLRIRVSYPDGRAARRRAVESFSVDSGSVIGFSSAGSGSGSVLASGDVSPPVFTLCPDDVPAVADVDSHQTTASWPTPTYTDNLLADTTLVFSHNAGQLFSIGTTTVTYNVTDGSGNLAVCSFDVVVADQQAPDIVCPASASHVYDLPSPSVTSVTVSAARLRANATDNSGLPPTMTQPTVTSFLTGVRPLVANATDAAGNTASCTFTVTVRDPFKPTFPNGCPPDQLEIEEGKAAVWSPPAVQDNVDPSPQLLPLPAGQESGTIFAVGNHTITYRARDASSNEASCSFVLRVNKATVAASSSGSASAGPMIGGAVGGIMVLVLIAVVLIMRRRHKLANAPTEFDFSANLKQIEQILSDGEGVIVPREINRRNVNLLDKLGEGQFGLVHKALLTEHAGIPPYLTAIKSLKENAGDQDREELMKEATLMAQFIHPHVVRLVGVVTLGEPVLVITEFMEHGSLQGWLQKKELTHEDKCLLAGDCAAGLEYISSRGFVHRDVAARNVLMSSEKRAKISDFGLSRDVDDGEYYQSNRNGAMPIRWTAPEALEHRRFSTMSDVWAYGILCYEIWTKGALPYKGMGNQKVWVATSEGYRLPCPSGCPKEVHDIMLACWDAEPRKRASFSTLKKQFRQLYTPEGEVDEFDMRKRFYTGTQYADVGGSEDSENKMYVPGADGTIAGGQTLSSSKGSQDLSRREKRKQKKESKKQASSGTLVPVAEERAGKKAKGSSSASEPEAAEEDEDMDNGLYDPRTMMGLGSPEPPAATPKQAWSENTSAVGVDDIEAYAQPQSYEIPVSPGGGGGEDGGMLSYEQPLQYEQPLMYEQPVGMTRGGDRDSVGGFGFGAASGGNEDDGADDADVYPIPIAPPRPSLSKQSSTSSQLNNSTLGRDRKDGYLDVTPEDEEKEAGSDGGSKSPAKRPMSMAERASTLQAKKTAAVAAAGKPAAAPAAAAGGPARKLSKKEVMSLWTSKDVGKRVKVEGYNCQGKLAFAGLHDNGMPCVGVALDEPLGRNDGSAKGRRYFQCKPKHGVLVDPRKVHAAPPAQTVVVEEEEDEEEGDVYDMGGEGFGF